MEQLGNILNDNNIPYNWFVYTNDIDAINNPNIVYKKPCLNIIDHIANADYLVQLSDNERILLYSNRSLISWYSCAFNKMPCI